MADQRRNVRSSEEPELVSGADEDGLVTMTVTADLANVVDVALVANWRRVIASSDLAGTVLRAFHAAQAAAIAARLEGLDTAAPTTPEPADDADVADGVTAPGYVQNLIYTVLDQLDAQVEQVARVSASRFDTEGPNGAVTVLVSGGQLAEVTVDPDWARRAPATDLAAEIRAAFAAAQSRTADLAAEVGGPTKELAELTELAMDPARFVGLVGMRGGKAD